MGIRRKTPEVDAATIINGFCERALITKTSTRVYPNIYLGRWEADILELTKAGYLYEYEVKVSRKDFKIDAKKAEYWRGTNEVRSKKYDVLLKGERVHYFSYVVPEGLIDPEEVPEWAGLIYVRPYYNRVCIGFDKETGDPIFDEHVSAWFTTVKDPKKLRTEKVTPKELEEIEKKVYFRYHQLRCKLIKQKLVTPFGIT